MTVRQYKKKFEDLYLKMQEEHGKITKIILVDTTEIHKQTMPINADFRIVDCSIQFDF